ncbi:hypothetical protein VE00_05736 [Pseudogymnoascus sp. WSF 3629]|nr:hypothetical protein VE00_05736 [Pseudogymnoascus sp. WSF 3629]
MVQIINEVGLGKTMGWLAILQGMTIVVSDIMLASQFGEALSDTCQYQRQEQPGGTSPTVTGTATTAETNNNSNTATALKLLFVMQRITQPTRSPFACHKKYENLSAQPQPCEPSVSLTCSLM